MRMSNSNRASKVFSDTFLKNLKIESKRYRLADAGCKGLLIDVTTSGSKNWIYRYYLAGKEKKISFGRYPLITLADARAKVLFYKTQVASGIDPQHEIERAKELASSTLLEKTMVDSRLTFLQLYDEYCKFKTTAPNNGDAAWTYETLKKHNNRFFNHVIPKLGGMKLEDMDESHLENCLLDIQAHGTLSIRNKVRTVFNGMFDYASSKRYESNGSKYISHNIARLISNSLFIKHKSKPFQHAKDNIELKQIVNEIWRVSATYEVATALKLAMYVFMRPANVVQLEWSEIDFENKQIRIDSQKMKMDRDHVLPMSNQVISLLHDIVPITGHSRYVFNSPYGGGGKPVSRDSLSNALRKNNIKLTTHGIRHSASTALNNLGFDSDAIELQLSHVIGGVRGVYNRSEKLEQRTKMMQAWADYLDELKDC